MTILEPLATSLTPWRAGLPFSFYDNRSPPQVMTDLIHFEMQTLLLFSFVFLLFFK
jgi:hypothetical protein